MKTILFLFVSLLISAPVATQITLTKQITKESDLSLATWPFPFWLPTDAGKVSKTEFVTEMDTSSKQYDANAKISIVIQFILRNQKIEYFPIGKRKEGTTIPVTDYTEVRQTGNWLERTYTTDEGVFHASFNYITNEAELIKSRDGIDIKYLNGGSQRLILDRYRTK